MNINVIKKKENLCHVVAKGSNILEVTLENDGESEYHRYFLYNPAKNNITEIAPDKKKYTILPVINCIWKSDTIYFASYEVIQDFKVIVSVYKYDPLNNSIECVLAFEDGLIILKGNKKIKIFVLSETLLIVQTEQKKDWESDNLMGSIEFKLTVCNTETGETDEVRDPNLINNGINMIIPVSETHMMLKTGYSFVEDDRLAPESEKDALIETVYYGLQSQFAASLTLGTSTKGYRLLGTAYYDKCILRPEVAGDYIYFTVLDHKNKVSETIFYNYTKSESIKCMNHDLNPDDLQTAYIVDNAPFVRRNIKGSTQFINIKSSEIDCVFHDEKFCAVLGKLFLFSRKRGSRQYLRAYKMPKLNLVFEERGNYAFGCILGSDYYIYV